jgi:sugar O-acyltransferase (sialic acid O-acetyltransferase NeuD family)
MSNKLRIALAGIDWDIVDLIDSTPHLEIAGYFDPSLSTFGEFKHFGDDCFWGAIKATQPSLKVVLAVDKPVNKAKLFYEYGEESIMTLISPHAHISKRAVVGGGSIIQRGVTILPQASLGRACKVHLNATIHHEAVIHDFCTIAPGAQLLGNVVLEEGVYVGAGAVIRQRCRIGSGSIVGAGAVVVQDVPPHVTVVGVPAKLLVRERINTYQK